MKPAGCPSALTLAAFVDGTLKREEIAVVLAHLDTCARCRSAVIGTNERKAAPAPAPWGWAVAAAAVIALALAGVWLLRLTQASPMTRLVQLAPQSARAIQPRLSGGFAWAPYEGPLRASEAPADPEWLKLAGAAGEIVEQANREHRPEQEHAAGLALLLIDRPLEAMTRLRTAADQSPNDAQVWSDLAAATYAAALRLERPSLYPLALDAADRALRIDAQSPEALFNRALTLEHLGLPQQAREAWDRYLRIDASSAWADEARAHLARIQPATSEMEFRKEQRQLEGAAMRGDQAAVEQFVRRYHQQSRTFAEAEYLGRWAEAVARDDAAAAQTQLTIARRIGAALARASGEQLLGDVVREIDSASGVRRAQLASAQLLYRRARIAFSRRQPAAAENDFRVAAREFGGNPMALVARYYAASARFDQNDAVTSRHELESLLREVAPRFIALDAQARWELALCFMINDEWSGALPLLDRAAASFRALGEGTNLAVMETMRADAMAFLGRPDEAWAARIRALQVLSEQGSGGNRLSITIGEAARMEARSGRIDAARALLAIEEAALRNEDDVLLADTLVREAVLNQELHDAKAAMENVREAFQAAGRIVDPALRERALADAHFAEGVALLNDDPHKAERSLTRAIEHYGRTDKAFFLPEADLHRAQARIEIGDAEGARADLDDGIAEVERHRLQLAGAVMGTGALDASAALFETAVRERLTRGDVAGAFAYSDRWRNTLGFGETQPVTLDALRQRLAGSGAAVLELIVLPSEVVAFCVTEHDAIVERRPIEDLDALVDGGDERALYELLVGPSERAWSGARSLIIVAAPPLDEVPFAALYDAGRRQHLIERLPVLLAPSASALRVAARRAAPRAVAAIALPAGESPALPGTAEELEEITRLYAERTTIPAARATLASLQDAAAQADVLHIAGHTERMPGGGDDALLFAGDGRATAPVSWRGIAVHPLRRAEVVVVAACETLRVPRSAQRRAMSLAGGFLAAGARDVIGTLTPVSDEQARAIFTSVHRNLARGQDVAQSLRDAQLRALDRERASGRRTAWRAVALLTTRIPRATN